MWTFQRPQIVRLEVTNARTKRFWLSIVGWCFILAGCSENSPQVDQESFISPAIVHARFPADKPCKDCHTADRNTLVGLVDGSIHGDDQDCQSCHLPVDDDEKADFPQVWLRYVPTLVGFNHQPDPEACVGCHGPTFNRDAQRRIDADLNPHTPYANCDCVRCHNFPQWNQFGFDPTCSP